MPIPLAPVRPPPAPAAPEGAPSAMPHIPTPPPGYEYAQRSYNGEHYATTGWFPVGAPDHQLRNLHAVVAVIGDADLCDWLLVTDKSCRGRSSKEVKAQLHHIQHQGTPLDRADLAATRAAHHRTVLESCRAVFGAPPSITVDSGYGVHVYYLLAEPATGPDIAKARELNQAARTAVNDHAGYALFDLSVHDTGTRILRAPGTVNSKGATPVPVRVLTKAPTTLDLHTFTLARPAPPPPPPPPPHPPPPPPPHTCPTPCPTPCPPQWRRSCSRRAP